MTRQDGTKRRGYGKPRRWVDRTGGPTLDQLDPAHWHPHAACNGLPPYLWLDEFAQSRTSRAVAICRSCPVRRTCLSSALVFGDGYGIYGGTTTNERAALTKRLRRGETLGSVLKAAQTRLGAAIADGPRTRPGSNGQPPSPPGRDQPEPSRLGRVHVNRKRSKELQDGVA